MDHDREGVPAAADPEGGAVRRQIDSHPDRHRGSKQQNGHNDGLKVPGDVDMGQRNSDNASAD
ncbi:hypothetical protein D3C76_1781630 [compost metagenome]